MFFAPAIRTRALAPSLRSFDRNFERFIDDAFFGRNASGATFAQDEKAFTLTLDLPGIAKSELTVAIEGAIVRIGTTAEAARQFKAAYELPEEIDAEASNAKLENGVLTLTLAKKLPVSKARTLSVQ